MSSDKNINPAKITKVDFSEHAYPGLNLKGAEEKIEEGRTEATEKVPEQATDTNRTDVRDQADSTQQWNAEKNRTGRDK